MKIISTQNNFEIHSILILVIHVGVACKMCGTKSIKGSLYTCLVCPDFMTCETCEKSRKHEHSLFETTSKLSK